MSRSEVQGQRIEESRSSSDRLDELLRGMSYDQLRYLAVRPFCSKDVDAAEQLRMPVETIYSWRYKGIPVDEALQLMGLDGVSVAIEMIRRSAPKAAAVKVAGLESEDERIRQNVATEVLDRGLGKPGQSVEISGPGGGPIEIDMIVWEWPDGDKAVPPEPGPGDVSQE